MSTYNLKKGYDLTLEGLPKSEIVKAINSNNSKVSNWLWGISFFI